MQDYFVELADDDGGVVQFIVSKDGEYQAMQWVMELRRQLPKTVTIHMYGPERRDTSVHAHPLFAE